VLAPGGVSAGAEYFGASGVAERYARRGYCVVVFDPDGRGRSEGQEALNGFAQQDGLAAVVRWAAAQPGVAPGGLVLASFSYGATLAVGALARHPDLPVRLLIDWEGPALRAHIARLPGAWAYDAERMADDQWWAEREAAGLIDRVQVPYQRVQGAPDHAQPDPEHALLMVRRALSRAFGGEGCAPWVRLNGNPPNRRWGEGSQPHWLPALPAEVAVLPYLVELAPPPVGSDAVRMG
jgi:pimeloyl-ACP methyl ester carboxylesterase